MIRTTLAAFAALAFLVPLASSGATVWVAHATEKIRPAAAARATREARISAAGNEFEAFQVIVTGAASGVGAVASDLTGPATLGEVRLYREAYIDVVAASALDTSPGPWPDALVPDVDEFFGERRTAFPFDVPAGESRAIWVEVFVPREAPPGDYGGTVKVTWAGGSADVPVKLHVWPFSLPSTATLKSAFGFSYGAIEQEHQASGTAVSDLRALYGRAGLDHRISLSHIDDGMWSDLPYYRSYYGPHIEGTASLSLGGARLTAVELMGSAATWSPFFEDNGWSDRLFQYTCDEPPLTCAWSDIPIRAAVARAAVPPIRTLVTTTVQEATARGVLDAIDILVPVINYLDDKDGAQFPGEQRSRYDEFLAGSPKRELWTYQSCMSHGCGGTVDFGNPSASDVYFTGWPSYTIDASAVRNRAMEWLSFRYGLTGELYYETVQGYGENPWVQQAAFGGNGDGTFFYPGQPSRIGGTKHIPVASIRLKMIREGMEDYEYLAKLASLGFGNEAQAIATGLFPRAFETEVAPEALMSARERLGARIAELTAGRGGGGGGTIVPPKQSCATSGGLGLGAAFGLVGAARWLRRRRRP